MGFSKLKACFNSISKDYNYCHIKYSVYTSSWGLENSIYGGVDED